MRITDSYDETIEKDAANLGIYLTAHTRAHDGTRERLRIEINGAGLDLTVDRGSFNGDDNSSSHVSASVKIPWQKLSDIAKALWEAANLKRIKSEAASTEAALKRR